MKIIGDCFSGTAESNAELSNIRAVASGGASGARLPHLKSVPPISRLTHQLLRTSNAVF